MSDLGSGHTLGRYLKQVLRPFARFALRHGLRMTDILETLRAAFVEVAEDELRRLAVKPSTSRLAVTTGLSRREVQRVSGTDALPAVSLSLPARVVGLWLSHPQFRLKGGKPKVLSMEGAGSEFNQLVRTISHDIHPASILFELERVGLVKKTTRGLQLIEDSFQSRDPEDGIRMLSQDLDQLLLAVDENLFAQLPEKNLHVRTASSFVAAADATEVREWLLKEGGAFHRRIRDYLAEHDVELNPKPGKQERAEVLVTTFGRLQARQEKP
jgi:hypothetical protein